MRMRLGFINEKTTEFITQVGGENPKVFGATYSDLNNPFYVELNDGLKEAIDRNGDQLISFDGTLDQANQTEQIERLIEYGVDMIFLSPVDWREAKLALEKSIAAGVPVFNVDTPVFDVDLVTSIITSDNYDAGIQNARSMMQRLDSANIAVLERPGVKSAIDRTQGFLDTIEGREEYKIVARQTTGGLLEDAIPVMENIIRAHPEINVVMAVDDPTALGALRALEDAGRDDVLIYSIDGSPDAKLMVKEGKIEATVAQSPITIGSEAAAAAYLFLNSGTVRENITVPVFIITRDNVDQYGVVGWQ